MAVKKFSEDFVYALNGWFFTESTFRLSYSLIHCIVIIDSTKLVNWNIIETAFVLQKKSSGLWVVLEYQLKGQVYGITKYKSKSSK